VIISWMTVLPRLPASQDLGHSPGARDFHLSLVLMAGIPLTFSTILVAFGSRIETRVLFLIGHDFGTADLLLWGAIRWAIAILTSIAVISLSITTRGRAPNHGTAFCRRGSGDAMWLLSTALFGWYCSTTPTNSVIYGSLGLGIALLVWMYLISLVILIGAEFNAMLFPRCLTKVPPPRRRRSSLKAN